MPEVDDNDPNEMPIYESRPPAWLPKTHGTADLGYSGFHPPRPGQDEDVMSAGSIKNGFLIGDSVPAETFSAQDMIKARITQHGALAELEDLMNEIFSRRADHVPAMPTSTFRMPSRVTLNDSKRQAWFADLANPDVPLHKLGKNVPHGAKGHDLLDLLQSHNVEISRAVWFLRVFGANETAGLRNKPSYNPTQYSVDWANVVTGYLKKQLADIALPSAPRAGLNIKQTFKGVLADTDSRARWISRFTYCLRLLRTFYSQGLVDNRTFLTWLVQTMANCNLAQAAFVARLGDEYLDGMLSSRALTKPFADACLGKLVEIQTTAAQEYLPTLEALLKTLLQRVCLALPDALVSIHTWTAHSALLTDILSADILDPDRPVREGRDHYQQIARDVQQMLLDNFLDVKRRNEAMLFRTLPPRVLASLGSTVMDIQLLNSISSTTDLSTIPFFDSLSDDPSLWAEKINTLFTWSITPLQFGDHRPYATATLLRLWRNKSGERAMRRDITSPDDFLQDLLFDWLDESELAREEANLSGVASLFGKLVRDGLFQYAKYVQRLVARGEPGLSYTQEIESRHRKFLRCIPLHHSTSSLVSQRKVTLHGARARETPEDLNEREIRKEIRAILPQLFGGEARTNYLSAYALLDTCPILVSASRFEQVRTFRQWLFPIFRKAIDSQSHDKMDASSLLQTYCVSVELMANTKCYGSILELNLFVLQRTSDSALVTAIIETFHRYVTIWNCMDAAASITAALHGAHQVARSRGIQSRALLALLVEIDNGRHLDAPSRENVSADIAAFTHALHPDSETPDNVPPVLPEILLLADDPNPEAPSILANSLWYKYRTAFDWAWKVWDNTVASLRQVPVMTLDVAGRQACSLCYGRFLLHVDQHLPGGIDDQVLQWFLGTGKNEVSALSADAWDVLTFVLLYLVVHGALTATTILRGLVYPSWRLGASANSEQQGESLAIFLRAANNLCDKLLLREAGGSDGMAPVDLLEVQRICIRRQTVYREPHYSLLVTAIPALVFIEKNEFISQDLRHASASLRTSLCVLSDFRQGAHRNLDAVRNAFEQPLLSAAVVDDCQPLVDALRLILSDSPSDITVVGGCDWDNISSLLSPWRLATTAIELQFTLRQMGRMLMQESTSQSASDCLDQLTANIFHHSMTSEEAYFVAEMARGVDGAVAGKFINNGLQCMSEMLRNTSLQPADLNDCVQRAGQLLRVLAHIAESMREEAALLPQLESAVQDEFIDVLSAKFDAIKSALEADKEADIGTETSHISQSLIFLARLLQFDLGFQGAWTAKTKGASNHLMSILFHLALIHSSGKHIDLVAYPLIIDTLYYVLDEIPLDAKSLAFDPFRNYPILSLSDLPADMPTDYRMQLRSLLSYVPPCSTITNLVTAHRDASGRLVLGTSVLNRPWEWIENLGEVPVPDAKHDDDDGDARVRHPIRNSASLSLDLFNARATGDGIISSAIGDDPRIEANIRSFEDGLSAESVFKRDWRETRIELEDDIVVGGSANRAEEVDELGGLPSFPRTTDRRSASHSRRPSPTSSIRSHKTRSTNPSIAPSSARSSPLQPPPLPRLSNSSSGEPTVIDVDAPSAAPATTRSTATDAASSTRRTSKRKLSNSDDEVEIIEGPVPAAAAGPSRAGKKPKGKTTAKTRAKKR